MNQMVEKMMGVDQLTDEMIAYDFLMSAKTGIRSLALAITEAATYEVRTMLQEQLDDAIGTHEQITNYMIKQEWYRPYRIHDQMKLDLKNAERALELSQ